MLRTLLLMLGPYLLGLACGMLIERCRHTSRILERWARGLEKLDAEEVRRGRSL